MSPAFDTLRAISLFESMDDTELERICDDVVAVHLDVGDFLFHEGDWGEHAYVVTRGRVEILKAGERRDMLLAVREDGDVIGEMALLQQEPRTASVRARTAVDLLAIPRQALDEVLEASPRAMRAIYETFVHRLKATNDQLKQTERMAQLGTLTAGVAHELNNPAAAIARAAHRLSDDVAGLLEHVARGAPEGAPDLVTLGVDPTEVPASALARSDAEEEVEDWLADRGVPAPWELAPDLVDAGIGVDELDGWQLPPTGPELEDLLRLAAAAVATRRTAAVIATAAGRLSGIVKALKSYAYLDQSPVQDVDVHRGLEDTLVLLAHKTRHVTIVRDYDDDLPTITAFGTELNQVWTNLVDNACDALDGMTDPVPTVTLRTRATERGLVVEVEDNGPGMPEPVQEQVFDAFFTTKPPGVGTGLGLYLSYRLVLEHEGELSLSSAPGRTVFRVELPMDRATNDGGADEDSTSAGRSCADLAGMTWAERPTGECPDCLADGDPWQQLRFCNRCGRIGCCDESPNRHASRHAETSGHPVIRSLEPGDDWAWCYDHELGLQR